jgi:hypothetical protein
MPGISSALEWSGNSVLILLKERTMASNIRVVVDEAKRGLVIRWFEDGLERHVWVDHERFEAMLASGETVYVDTPAIATQQSYALAHRSGASR